MELLIAKGANVNAQNGHNPITDEWRWGEDTPLHYAAAFDRLEAVELLLANNADINAFNQYGETPLWRAANKGRVRIVRLLIEHGADVNAKGKGGRTPLWEANYQLTTPWGPRSPARADSQAIIEILRQHGAKK